MFGRTLLVAVAAVVALPASASAQFDLYTDESVFLGALSGYTTEGFEGFEPGDPLPFTFDYLGGGTATITKGQIIADPANTDKDPVVGNRAYGYYPNDHGVGGEILFSSYVTGFGSWIRDLDVGSFDLRFYRGATEVFVYSLGYSLGNGSTIYRGFTAPSGMEFDRIWLDQHPGDWVTYDDMTVAPMEVGVVPEPGTIVLLGTGLLGVLVLHRRRLGVDGHAAEDA